MDVYEYLKMDHKKVADLFKQFEKAKNQKQQIEIYSMIEKELILHSYSEQETFYKVLEHHVKSKKEVLHGEKEHKEIQDLIKQINKLRTSNQKWQNTILELKKTVEHHVSDEEGKIFNVAKKVLSKDEANIIKEKMHDYKERMLEKEIV